MTTNVLVPVALFNERRIKTELQAHIFQSPSITVERFPLSNRYNISYAQFIHCILSFRKFKDFRKLKVLQKLRKRNHVVTFLHLLLLTCIYCIGCSAAWVYNKMETLCTLHERHTYAMCTRKKAALHVSVQDNVDTLDILLKKKPSFMFY